MEKEISSNNYDVIHEVEERRLFSIKEIAKMLDCSLLEIRNIIHYYHINFEKMVSGKGVRYAVYSYQAFMRIKMYHESRMEKASENNSYRALLSEDKYNKQKEINQEMVEENESLKELIKKLKAYRCKNQHKVITETGKTADCHAFDCYKMYNCENCGYLKEIKEND